MPGAPASRGGASSVSSPRARPSDGCRRREAADAECIGGQADERVGARFDVPVRERPRPAVPAAGLRVPAELPQERGARCCAPAKPAARREGGAVHPRGRPPRCCIGPARPATTARSHSSSGVVATGSGQSPGSSPNAALRSTVAAASGSARMRREFGSGSVTVICRDAINVPSKYPLPAGTRAARRKIHVG